MATEAKPWFLIQPFDVALTPDGRALTIEAVFTAGATLHVLTGNVWYQVDPTAMVTVVAPTAPEAYQTVMSLFPGSELVL